MMTLLSIMTNVLDIPILHEDDAMLVLAKPADVLVHTDGKNTDTTIVDWFLARCPEASGVGEQTETPQGEVLERSGVVHRLDRDTSGVLVLAKTEAAFMHLKAQFHDRLVEKTYRTFVYGTMKAQTGTIDRAIGRSPRDFRKRSAMRGAKGRLREAVTHWRLLQAGVYEGEQFSYLEVKPVTGRTHQIRVHLRAIERPVVGDQLYAGHKGEHSNNLGLNRLALHAYALNIMLPNGTTALFTAPEPDTFIMAAKRLT